MSNHFKITGTGVGLVLLIAFIALNSFNYKSKRVDAKSINAVELREVGGKIQLFRNGAPYFIKGAGIYKNFYNIKQYGANSVRIWNTENAKEILDSAHFMGLTVTVGLSLAYGKDMDYSDEQAVAAQLARLKDEVIKYKNHPALLMWGVGNEVDLKLNNSSIITKIRLWNAVNDVAKMVHEVDPNHPTTTMISDVKKLTIRFISMFCKNIDILSINLFTEKDNLDKQIQAAGWNGAYIISEFGVLGHWDAPRTDWYARIEPTSFNKAQLIRKQYKSLIESNKGKCLGSYAFIWSTKQEYTSTWFSLLTEAGQQTEMTDALHYIWTGKWPLNRAPSIYSININKRRKLENIYLEAGEKFTVGIKAKDIENEKLILNWEIQKENAEIYFDPTRSQKKPEVYRKGALQLNQICIDPEDEEYKIKLNGPKEEGPYRLFFYVQDEQNKTATANVTFYIYN